jgi:hypothetical protein
MGLAPAPIALTPQQRQQERSNYAQTPRCRCICDGIACHAGSCAAAAQWRRNWRPCRRRRRNHPVGWRRHDHTFSNDPGPSPGSHGGRYAEHTGEDEDGHGPPPSPPRVALPPSSLAGLAPSLEGGASLLGGAGTGIRGMVLARLELGTRILGRMGRMVASPLLVLAPASRVVRSPMAPSLVRKASSPSSVSAEAYSTCDLVHG